jgi:hypothetical protein
MTLRNDGAILSTKFDFTIWSRLTTSQSSGFLPTLVHEDVKNRKTKRSQINDGCEITSRSNSDILILKKLTTVINTFGSRRRIRDTFDVKWLRVEQGTNDNQEDKSHERKNGATLRA